jgi:hypothetical protein
MATGSGKTLLMHINYLQFLHYNKKTLDNLLLITPNEGLSQQHMVEMSASNIPTERFEIEESGLGLSDPNTVRVIEITKLVETKTGSGVSVPVEAFEGNNLIFVDEGHKGSGGTAWRNYREALGKTGFTFEYSATFGQALTAAGRDELTEEYGKAILFDYSYRYFYEDGFGKDFQLLNLRNETAQDETDLLLLGNLLGFYEQSKLYSEKSGEIKAYNIDKPLWVFVGKSVNAVYTENRNKRSDVLTVARFLHRFLANEGNWTIKAIDKLLAGATGLQDGEGKDVFSGKFLYLKTIEQASAEIREEILTTVFNAPAGGQLHIANMKGKSGELGLKAGGSSDYFGLIYIGDTSEFKKLLEADDIEFLIEDDAITDSLFDGINSNKSSINMLIGAKKFMEGWNSWRVSSMGLLNIGRKEGSEIIQLFGRGVRLRGLDFSLKRSSALHGHHPDFIAVLETLSIFAIRANYMAQFREYLEREGVEPDGFIKFPLPIKKNEEFIGKGLLVPRIAEGYKFADEVILFLEPDKSAKVGLDLSVRAETVASSTGNIKSRKLQAGEKQEIPAEILNLLDWEKIYLDLVSYRDEKGYDNLIVLKNSLRSLLKEGSKLFSFICPDDFLEPESFSGVLRIQTAVQDLLRKYLDKFYRVRQDRWESGHLTYEPITSDDSNFQDYIVKVPASDTGLVGKVKSLFEDGTLVYSEDLRGEPPRIFFDRHLYQPLLLDHGKIKSEPVGLQDSERDFIKGVREHFEKEKDKSLADKEIYLLRNLSRGKGIGFFEKEGFYPDFLLWVKSGDSQRVIFVEPHGMLMEKAYAQNDKATLHERLRDLAKTIAKSPKRADVNMDSFIVSATKYEDLKPQWGDGNWTVEKFAEHHILFLDQGNLGTVFSA